MRDREDSDLAPTQHDNGDRCRHRMSCPHRRIHSQVIQRQRRRRRPHRYRSHRVMGAHRHPGRHQRHRQQPVEQKLTRRHRDAQPHPRQSAPRQQHAHWHRQHQRNRDVEHRRQPGTPDRMRQRRQERGYTRSDHTPNSDRPPTRPNTLHLTTVTNRGRPFRAPGHHARSAHRGKDLPPTGHTATAQRLNIAHRNRALPPDKKGLIRGDLVRRPSVLVVASEVIARPQTNRQHSACIRA